MSLFDLIPENEFFWDGRKGNPFIPNLIFEKTTIIYDNL